MTLLFKETSDCNIDFKFFLLGTRKAQKGARNDEEAWRKTARSDQSFPTKNWEKNQRFLDLGFSKNDAASDEHRWTPGNLT